MKGDWRIRKRITKAQDLKMLGWVVRRCEVWSNDEAEPVIVVMITKEDTPLGAVLTYRPKAGLDELATHATPLKQRFDRHRSEGKPSVHRG